MAAIASENRHRMTTVENTEKQKNLFPGAKFGLKFTREEQQFSKITTENANLVSFLVALLFFGASTYIHLDLVGSIWKKYTRTVNRTACSCNCWDSSFKSNYEAGIPNYKHVYFNITSNTFKIWIMTVFFILASYESIRKICHLYLNQRLRMSMLILFATNIYPHYYSWWAYFNFLNDDYYYQLYHQFLFTGTELISTLLVVFLLDKSMDPMPWKLVSILAIAVSHSLISLTDQFGHNVLRGQGEIHQVLRDIGFMTPDIFHVIIPLMELKKLSKKRHTSIYLLISNRVVGFGILFIVFMWILSLIL